MPEYRYASWVKGDYLLWTKDNPKLKSCPRREAIKEALKTEQREDVREELEKALNKPPKKRIMATFLQNGFSEPHLKTLREIAKAEPIAKNINLEASSGYIGYQALQIVDTLLNQLESYYFDYDINTKKATKKKLMPVLDQWRNVTIKLLDILHSTHIYKASDLIKGAPDILITDTNIETMCRDRKALNIALQSHWEKTAEQALLEFADEVESLANGNPHYVLNNRAPTETQARIQLVVHLIINMIDIDATKELSGLADLIIYLLELINEYDKIEDDEQLCPREVNRQIKATIENYETLIKK